MNNRVWTYVIGKTLNEEELNNLISEGTKFVSEWTAHEQQLEASFHVLDKHLIVVKVNEDAANASGCSIDKLTRFVKQSSQKYEVDLLDRFTVAYKKDNQVHITHSSKIKELLQQQLVSENTIVFNTAVSNEAEFSDWEQPLKNTWLKKYLD